MSPMAFGSKFFVMSMLFDKALMIFLRYGKFLLFFAISLLCSSYLYIISNYGFSAVKAYNLINRPEVAVKYFWFYLKYYYYNRGVLPLSFTAKVVYYLVAPYIFLKLISFILNFCLFYLAMKMQRRYPIISNFLLRKTVLSPSMKTNIVNSVGKSSGNNNNAVQSKNSNMQNINNNSNEQKKNLRM